MYYPVSVTEYGTNAFNSKWKYEKLAVVVHFLQTTEDLAISSCNFAEDGKEMYQNNLLRTCTAIVLLIKNVLYDDVLVAIAVVFALRS